MVKPAAAAALFFDFDKLFIPFLRQEQEEKEEEEEEEHAIVV